MTVSEPFAGLAPSAVWEHFSAMTRIARPSGHEAEMARYVLDWAGRRDLSARTDAAGNVCVKVPGSRGRENAPTVVLQGHLDMVCERDAASPYDAEQGRIHVVRDGGWLRAEGTTLGADNGIGVALALAAAEVADAPHGPLELLFTIDEENGLTGAHQLDPTLLTGRVMLNLDSEDDGMLFVGCAGGCDIVHTLTLPRITPPMSRVLLEITVSGVKGGHSGLEIDKNRVNAIKALARLLGATRRQARFLLAALDGGNKRNAIPREARAVVYVPPKEESGFRDALAGEAARIAQQYKGLDDGFGVAVNPLVKHGNGEAWGHEDSLRVIDLVRALPFGVIAVSQSIPGLVETSSNVGVATTRDATLEIACLSRSSNSPALDDLADTIANLGRLAGATVEISGRYPGWQPDMSSRALAVTRAAFERLYGRQPAITAIHAGLECGLIGEHVPGMDMISFGPTIAGAHAPGERVEVDTVEKAWRLLLAVLDDLSKAA